MTLLPVAFVGGGVGSWAVQRIDAVRGATLAPAARVDVMTGAANHGSNGW